MNSSNRWLHNAEEIVNKLVEENQMRSQPRRLCDAVSHFTNFVFHHESKSIEISFHYNSIPGCDIATNLRTYHDSRTIVPCANYRTIGSFQFGWERNDFCSNLNCVRNNVSEMGLESNCMGSLKYVEQCSRKIIVRLIWSQSNATGANLCRPNLPHKDYVVICNI